MWIFQWSKAGFSQSKKFSSLMFDNQLDPEQTSHRCNRRPPPSWESHRWILKTTRPSSSWEGHRWNSEFSRRHDHLPGGGELKWHRRWDVLQKISRASLGFKYCHKNWWRCWMTPNPWKWSLVRLRLRSHIWKSWTGFVSPLDRVTIKSIVFAGASRCRG